MALENKFGDMAGRGGTLPPGFDPAVWKGWTKYNIEAIHRCLSCRKWMRVTRTESRFYVDLPSARPAWIPYMFDDEPEAAAFCENYAAERGGWANPICTPCTHCGDPLPESTVEPGLCVECKAVFDLRREDYP
jgi:hypothetical protein